MIDYTVMVNSTEFGDFIARESGITDTKVTLTGFTLGQTYVFKVKSRNEFDFSALS